MTKGSYWVTVMCNNCSLDRTRIAISKGRTVASQKCPNCGCKTLRSV